MARFPQRSDLYWISLEVEEDGDKERPIVVVSRDELNRGDRISAVPFYSQQLEKRAKQEWCALFAAGEGGLKKPCVAKGDEIQLIDPMETFGIVASSVASTPNKWPASFSQCDTPCAIRRRAMRKTTRI